MSYLPHKVFTGSIASAATTVSFVLDRAYENVSFQIPTLSTSAEIKVFGSTDGATWYQVYQRVSTSSSVQYQAALITSGMGANGAIAVYGISQPYIQLRASGVIDNGATIKVIGHG